MATTPKKISALSEVTTLAVGDLLAVVDISEPADADKTKKVTMTNLGKILPELAGLINVGFSETYDVGDSGANKEIDWTDGNVQKVKLTANCTFTFVAPDKTCGLTLILIGDGTVRTTDFPAAAEFVDNGEPLAWGSTSDEIVGVISIRYDSVITPNYIMSASAKV